MAKIVKKKNIKAVKKSVVSPFQIYWEKKNYIFLFAGMALLVLGFYFMSLGNWDSTASLVISPLILGVAYILIFPASILYRKKVEVPTSETAE
ncbi:MAG: DUF3098 domain-containing protein [Ignavibacteriaceae bacterium]|nr:DUF3098 domain-containing protein [Ignavibacteriaceae bacterium]